MARKLIRDGRLPIVFSRNLIAGYGSGLPCCLCEQPIERQHVEYEVTASSRERELIFHLVCHAAWQLECVAIRSSQDARASGPPEQGQRADTTGQESYG